MSTQNVRLQATYGGVQIGSNGISPSPYFIDASNKKIRMERKEGKFRFSCEVVVSDTAQASFQTNCTALEAAFDRKAGPNASLRIESDTQVYENFDRQGLVSASITAFGSMGAGAFTLTINGTAYTFQAGVQFNAVTSNLVTAQNLAAAINASAANPFVSASVSWLGDAKTTAVVYIQTKNNVFSTSFAYSGAGASATPATTNAVVTTGFNAVPSISKDGSDDDAAVSRRYMIEVVLDLPQTEANKNGRSETLIEIGETAEMGDSKRQQLKISGAYSALNFRTALAQYDNSIDTFATSVQQALGGTWEGPFDVIARPDAEYAFATNGTRAIGSILRFSRTYDELIYTRGLGDDVRLRRQKLIVKFATEAPGDYGPNGQQVFRLRRASIDYSAGVDKTKTQDLRTVWLSVVKPFLIDEAKKAMGTGSIALTFQEPALDRVRNRIAATVQVMGASNGQIIESTVTTDDSLDAGKHLVHVWDGGADGLGKQDYDGPKVLKRVVRQVYKVLQGPSAAAGKSQGGGVDQFGIFGINKPTAFITITEASAAEAAIDSFFGLGVLSPGGQQTGSLGSVDDEPGFPVSGGVPEPKFTRAFLGGAILVAPNVLGVSGDPQLRVTAIVKVKTYEYYRPAKIPGPTKDKTKTPTLKDFGQDEAGAPTPTTRSKAAKT